MDTFEKKAFQLPIELMIALALNVVLVFLGYYAVLIWEFTQG